MKKRVITISVCIIFFAAFVFALQDTTKISSLWVFNDEETENVEAGINSGFLNERSSKSFYNSRTEDEVLVRNESNVSRQVVPPQEYVPEVGQGGKDVIWIPTPQVLVDKMLDMAKVTPKDYVMDLGSGDGRIVITAAKLGARAMGIEYNPYMIELSKRNAAEEGVSDRATFVEADLFKTDFSRATVITMFLLQRLNERLRPKILDLKPGTRVVSNTFDMGEWEADEVITVRGDNCFGYCTAYFWVVPAKAEGIWKFPQGDMTVLQNFQMITGTLRTGGVTSPIKGRMTGERISFSADGRQYKGRVRGNTMKLEVDDGSDTRWSATLMAR
jgi:SAM-dependent methyltransferase